MMSNIHTGLYPYEICKTRLLTVLRLVGRSLPGRTSVPLINPPLTRVGLLCFELTSIPNSSVTSQILSR